MTSSAPGRIFLKRPYIRRSICAEALAYRKEKLILSKQEGGQWGLKNLPERYGSLIRRALDDYGSTGAAAFDEGESREYAVYMIQAIRA